MSATRSGSLFVALTLAALASAQTKTTVTGTLVTPTGDKVSGTCEIQSLSQFSSGIYRVVGPKVSVAFASGALSVALIPTDSAVPSGQSYQVNCSSPEQKLNGRRVLPYTWPPTRWMVPSGSPVDIAQVTAALPPVPSLRIPVGQLAAGGVGNGTYCLQVAGGAVIGLVACSGGGSGAQSWAGLTSGAWSGMTSTAWSGVTP